MKRLIILTLFILICAYAPAQNSQTGAYLIPKIVYVGDIATLVLPLPRLAASEASEIALAPNSPGFPSDPVIDFHRVILERRPTGGTLLLEFSAFHPGLLHLPPIEIGGERFTGLSVEIRSVIDKSGAGFELSPPAAALAIPGTASLIYGTLASLAALLLFTIWVLLRGRKYLAVLFLKWKRRRMLASMKYTGRRLQRAMLKGGKSREILDTLSLEFRKFLSVFSGENCLSMTAREFDLEPEFFQITFEESSARTANGFLGGFFRRCDELRFSGSGAGNDDVFTMLADLQLFLEALDKGFNITERGKAA